MFCQSVRYFFVVSLILLAPAPGRATADERGTVGIYFAQLFDDDLRPSHRGPLVVLRVVEESAAAKAGIHSGDFVVAVNGVPVPGRELPEIMSKDIHGPIGATLRLTVVKPDGSRFGVRANPNAISTAFKSGVRPVRVCGSRELDNRSTLSFSLAVGAETRLSWLRRHFLFTELRPD